MYHGSMFGEENISPDMPHFPSQLKRTRLEHHPFRVAGCLPVPGQRTIFLVGGGRDAPESTHLHHALLKPILSINAAVIMCVSSAEDRRLLDHCLLTGGVRVVLVLQEGFPERSADPRKPWIDRVIEGRGAVLAGSSPPSGSPTGADAWELAGWLSDSMVINAVHEEHPAVDLARRLLRGQRHIGAVHWPSRSPPFMGNHLLIESGSAMPIRLNSLGRDIDRLLRNGYVPDPAWEQIRLI